MISNVFLFKWRRKVFLTEKVAGRLLKLSELIFKVFILCFKLAYLFTFCTISLGLLVQFRYLLANLKKIYVYDVNMSTVIITQAWIPLNIYLLNHQLLGCLGNHYIHWILKICFVSVKKRNENLASGTLHRTEKFRKSSVLSRKRYSPWFITQQFPKQKRQLLWNIYRGLNVSV